MFESVTKKTLITFAALLMVISLPLLMACEVEEVAAPEADFSATPTSGPAPLEVSFSDESNGDVTEWEWDFNDDGIVDSTEQNPTFTYEATGTYTVVLTVSGPEGEDTLRRTDYIVVNDVPDNDEAQWAAFSFDREVAPAEGEPGVLTSFTVRQIYEEDGEVVEFLIEATYESLAVEQIRVNRLEIDQETSDMDETVETIEIECYEIRNHITVERDDTGADRPDWIEITLFIPVEDLNRETDSLLVYAKSVYEDADGYTSEWSYYLTNEMREEMADPPEGTQVFFAPYVEDDLPHFDAQIITAGLYGWAWSFAMGFTIDGEQQLAEGTVEWGGHNYTITREMWEIGEYVFDAWTIEATIDIDGVETFHYRSVIAPDLPMPIQFELEAFDLDEEEEFRMFYELIELELS